MIEIYMSSILRNSRELFCNEKIFNTHNYAETNNSLKIKNLN